MAIILGFSAYFHDSSACVIKDGKIIAAAVEERFSRIKHDAGFPEKAIAFCLKEAQISSAEIDEVVYFEKPFTKFERIMDAQMKAAPKGCSAFRKTISSWLKTKFWVEDDFKKRFPTKAKFTFCQHHLSHASLIAFSNPCENAAYLVIDGVGERATVSFGTLKNGELNPLSEQRFPHSIGLLYTAFTQYCGFKVNSGEYKLMGLAPYGKPVFTDLILDNFVSINEDAEVKLNLKNFGFVDDLYMINSNFEKVFGQKARKVDGEMTDFYQNVAASIQVVTEELICEIAKFVQKATNEKTLMYSGGVALNCVANSKLLANTSFESILIHSASGDSGCAMGAALWRNEDKKVENIEQDFLGPQFSDTEIHTQLDKMNLNYQLFSETDCIQSTAKSLSENKVVGWFQGRMEFGPRALGNRSILANPREPNMKEILNLKIKKREGFRPFAPVVLSEYFNEYFVDEGYDYSKMLFVAKGKGKAKLIPSCIHEDNTARVQHLEQTTNDKLYALLTEFNKLTDCPVLINTSFNERGEPMVCSPKDAIHCFFNTEMDVLVLNNYIVFKDENSSVQLQNKSYELD